MGKQLEIENFIQKNPTMIDIRMSDVSGLISNSRVQKQKDQLNIFYINLTTHNKQQFDQRKNCSRLPAQFDCQIYLKMLLKNEYSTSICKHKSTVLYAHTRH